MPEPLLPAPTPHGVAAGKVGVLPALPQPYPPDLWGAWDWGGAEFPQGLGIQKLTGIWAAVLRGPHVFPQLGDTVFLGGQHNCSGPGRCLGLS